MKTSNPPLVIKERYRLSEWIGKGKMGVVYRAHDETLDRDVAIKFLSASELAGEEASSRFLREARAVARLSHSNIMAIYDVGQENDWHFLVLEFISGETLRSLTRRRGGKLTPPQAVQIVASVLQALAYAHEQGVIHRDIKPENIMITPDARVKVTDFGLALPRGDIRLTQDGILIGTVLYMAPEIVNGGAVDERADLYAIGAVLYEILAGRSPFTGNDILSIISQIAIATPEPLQQLNPEVPAELEQVIMRLLAKDPQERYPSAAAVLQALSIEKPSSDSGTTLTRPAGDEEAAHSLLESIVRGSSILKAEVSAADPDEEALLVLPEPPGSDSALTRALLVYASLEDSVTAVEVERRRLAVLLKQEVVDPLNLLLSQAHTYEQTLGSNPTVRMAVSVLTALARQIQQQARDLEANLHPQTLESLGLEPALQALANQVTRAVGMHIDLSLERLRERLLPRLELALFRSAQDVLELAQKYHAMQVTIILQSRAEELVFEIQHNGSRELTPDLLPGATQRLQQIGGVVETEHSSSGFYRWLVRLPRPSPVQITPREQEVIEGVTEGLSNKEIARRLSISPRTVNFHLDNLYSKLGVNTRTEAAIFALRQGWVQRALEPMHKDAPV